MTAIHLPPNTTLKSNATYIIEKKIGQGGFGITYKGKGILQQKLTFRTIRHQYTVCIKELFIQDSCGRSGTAITFSNTAFKNRFRRFKDKFLREAQTLAKFQDEPHIVSILDIFEANNTAYIVMDYIEGQSLQQVLQRNGKLPIDTALKYIRQVGKALQAAHNQNIYHLDVKPSNILINQKDEAILIDFGIAKQLKEGKALITYTTRAYTDGYAAIEQYAQSDRVKFTPATDIYAFGATLYKCLTGILPEAATSRTLFEIEPPHALNRAISKALSDVVLKAMALRPNDRFQKIATFLDQLKAARKEEDGVIIGEVVLNIIHKPKKVVNDFCEMVYVKGGSFRMGDEHGDLDKDCRPVHQVTLDSFYIGKYPITQKQWKEIMGSNPSHFKGNENRPVEQVSWDDIQEFIKKLHAKTGLKYRLPTEAEWEYAARGGQQSKGYKYAGSNNIEEVAWYWKNSGDKILDGKWDWDKISANNCKTHPVGQKQPNELGLYDMSGNVWEWCADGWDDDYYAKCKNQGAIKNPKGAANGSYRVYRGGGWSSIARNCRVAPRNYFNPTRRSNSVGFRLVFVP